MGKINNGFHHRKLDNLERKLIHDRSDLPVISLIDALSLEQIKKMNDSLRYKQDCLVHSNCLQMEWMKNYMYFWGEKNKHDPNECVGDCMKDFLGSIQPLRYRVWFAVHYPDEVEILKDKGDYELTQKFLEQARNEFSLAYSREQKKYNNKNR